jgi:ATP-dependent Lon protease
MVKSADGFSGMAYQGSGQGGILLLESMLVPGGKGRLVLTGSLGDVIKESAELGLTWVSLSLAVVFAADQYQVKSRALALGITQTIDEDPLQGVDVHVSSEVVCRNTLSGKLTGLAALAIWCCQERWTVGGCRHGRGVCQSPVRSNGALDYSHDGRDYPSWSSVSISARQVVAADHSRTPVGGIKEKVLGAHRAGITKWVLFHRPIHT